MPANARGRIQARPARFDGDILCDNECRIEADAELANQLGVFLLVAGHLPEELRGPGAGDGAKIIDQFLA